MFYDKKRPLFPFRFITEVSKTFTFSKLISEKDFTIIVKNNVTTIFYEIKLAYILLFAKTF